MTLLRLKETEMGRFVPNNWVLTDELRKFARDKRLTDSMIDDQLEDFRLCEFPRSRTDWDRCWKRWIKNSIKWGNVVPVRDVTYRQPKQQTPEQKAIDDAKADENLEKLTDKARLRSVK